MKTPEGKVKDAVKALLTAYDCWQNWPVPGGYGIPMLDCVACHNGRFFMVETKAVAELTPRQSFTKAQVELAGGKVFIVGERIEERDPDTWYSGYAELEAWLKQ